MKYKSIIGNILVWISYIIVFLIFATFFQSLKGIFEVCSKEDNSYAFGYIIGNLLGYIIFLGLTYVLYSFGKKLKKQ